MGQSPPPQRLIPNSPCPLVICPTFKRWPILVLKQRGYVGTVKSTQAAWLSFHPCRIRPVCPGRGLFKVVYMKYVFRLLALLVIVLAPNFSAAQAGYQVVAVQDGGTIKGTVKWQGASPHLVPSEINRDPEVCDPLLQKRRDLERLLVGPNCGVANTGAFLKNGRRGQAMDLPVARRFLDQKTCRYEPHLLLVPVQASLTVR